MNMMAVSTFNDASLISSLKDANSIGYGRSNKASRDSEWDYGDRLTPGLLGSFNAGSGAVGSTEVQAPTGQSVFGEPSGTTVIQQLSQGTNFDFSININPASMMRKSNMLLKDGAKVATQRENGICEANEKKGQMKALFDKGKEQTIGCLKEAASNQGHDPDSVVSQICPSEHTKDKGTAAAALAGDAVVAAGLGSLVTGVCKAGYIVSESKKDRETLNDDQRKALYEETERIAKSGGPKDTRDSGGGGPQEVAPVSKDDYLASLLDKQGVEMILSQTFENQKECRECDDLLHKLEVDVKGNHGAVAANYAGTDLLNKGETLRNAGQSKAVETMFDQATIPVDSYQVETAGMLLSTLDRFGMGAEASNDPGLLRSAKLATVTDMSSITTRYAEVDYKLLAGEVANHAYKELQLS